MTLGTKAIIHKMSKKILIIIKNMAKGHNKKLSYCVAHCYKK